MGEEPRTTIIIGNNDSQQQEQQQHQLRAHPTDEQLKLLPRNLRYYYKHRAAINKKRMQQYYANQKELQAKQRESNRKRHNIEPSHFRLPYTSHKVPQLANE